MLEQLYRLTPLEDSFNINNVALVDGQPQTLGLRDLLQRLHRAPRPGRHARGPSTASRAVSERLHLVEGLLIAILDIDEVIQVIRTSDDADAARTRLQEVFDLSQLQAEYILELRLRRLTRFSRIELEAERDKLRAEIAELEELLASDARIRALVVATSSPRSPSGSAPRGARSSPRRGRSRAGSSRKAIAAADLEVADVPCRVFLSSTGRASPRRPAARRRGARRHVARPGGRKHDAIRSALDTTSRTEIGAVTSRGPPHPLLAASTCP